MGSKASKVPDQITTCYNPTCARNLTVNDIILDKDNDINCAHCGAYTGVRFDTIPEEYKNNFKSSQTQIPKKRIIVRVFM